MPKIIKFYTENVYGNPTDYVIDPDDAKLIRELTGKKTLPDYVRLAIVKLTNGAVYFEKTIKPI